MTIHREGLLSDDSRSKLISMNTLTRGHHVVTADTVNPVAIQLARLGRHEGHDYVRGILAASAACADTDLNTEALVASYRTHYQRITESC